MLPTPIRAAFTRATRRNVLAARRRSFVAYAAAVPPIPTGHEDGRQKHRRTPFIDPAASWQQRRHFGLFTGLLKKMRPSTLDFKGSLVGCPIEEKYNVLAELGAGRYGVVKRGELKDGYGASHADDRSDAVTNVAIKSVRKSMSDTVLLQREIDVLQTLSNPPHRNVMRLVACHEDGKYVHIVSELYEGGELFDHIISKDHFSERDAAIYVRQILDSVAACHRRNIAHRDIKPENLMFRAPPTANAADDELCLVDFGFALEFDPSANTMTDQVGSPSYVAPEVLAGNFTEQCDAWSIGVVMYILLCGESPFTGKEEEETMANVRRGTFSMHQKEWDAVSEEGKELVGRLLTKDPAARLTIEEALAHPWIVTEGFARTDPLPASLVQNLREFHGTHKLKRAAIGVVAQHMNSEELGDLERMFKDIDTEGRGYIAVEDFTRAIRDSGDEGLVGAMDELVDEVDADGDGKVDWEEFLAVGVKRSTYLQEEHLRRAFDHFDLNGDGRISREELYEVLGSIGDGLGSGGAGAPQSPVEVVRMLDELMDVVDLDGDGSIDYEEFVTMMKTDSSGSLHDAAASVE